MKPWKRIEPTVVHKTGWRVIVTKTFVTNEGKTVTFDTFGTDHQDYAVIVAVTTNKTVLVTRQFRVGPERVLDELPGGFVDEGETPETAAHRELLEETGYVAGNMEYLGVVTAKDAYLNGAWHAYLATDCRPSSNGATPEEFEEIELAEISIDQLIENAKSDKLTDPLAVFYAYDKLNELRMK